MSILPSPKTDWSNWFALVINFASPDFDSTVCNFEFVVWENSDD